jgi:hypothetical protein
VQFFFFFEIFYCIAIIPIKLSISFMLIRIASRKKAYTYAVYAISVMFTLMNLIALLYIIFQCKPVRYVLPPPFKVLISDFAFSNLTFAVMHGIRHLKMATAMQRKH